MYCKVYKLSEIPGYQEVGGARLPIDPGELIVTGETTVTPTTGEALNGLITFTLNAQDPMTGLTYEYHPTIDYPIMIAIEGYNDPGMEDLVEFSAYVSVDGQVDEGYGELAYLKTGLYETKIDENGDTVFDEEGNPVRFFTGEYQWRGLNNYFSSGTLSLKTGLSIFIGVDQPYLAFAHGALEDAEYVFPNNGGQLVKDYDYSDSTVTCQGIQFITSAPSDSLEWSVTCREEELPEWLDIELIDGVTDGQFNDTVMAVVTAEPLPQRVSYREAVVRFAIPGDYKEYVFRQGLKVGPVPCDVNDDGEVNIADVNSVISIILGGNDIYEGRADVNRDGEINIADVNRVIAAILGNG